MVICEINFQGIDLLLKVIGGITATVLFFIGFWRYNREQKWKRKEFVAKEIKEFHEDRMNKNAMLMLDWDTRNIELYPEHPEYEKRFVKIGRKELAKALIPHHILSRSFNRDEAIIRDTFDHFLSNITRFEHFVETGIVSIEDFKPYLRYWMDAIAYKLPEPSRSVLHHYILAYEYVGVMKFLARFGREIKPTQSLDILTKEIN
ncbi:MAG: hypothetical protein J0M29_19690 [Chitinophagales bacterium]|nr:hypothetical protein [Chitinophagales bacterium]